MIIDYVHWTDWVLVTQYASVSCGIIGTCYHWYIYYRMTSAQCQFITRDKSEVLQNRHTGLNFSEILIKTQTLSLKKNAFDMRLLSTEESLVDKVIKFAATAFSENDGYEYLCIP